MAKLLPAHIHCPQLSRSLRVEDHPKYSPAPRSGLPCMLKEIFSKCLGGKWAEGVAAGKAGQAEVVGHQALVSGVHGRTKEW